MGFRARALGGKSEMKLDLSAGIRLAAFLFLAQSFIAVGSYLLACVLRYSQACSITNGWLWITHHPVFSDMIVTWTIGGFLIGTFGKIIVAAVPHPIKGLLTNYKGWLAWIVVALLIAAFLLWGLPVPR